MDAKIKIAIERYVNNCATYSERETVIEYLLSDFEHCYEILNLMRERAMRELSIDKDSLIEDVIINQPIGLLLDSSQSYTFSQNKGFTNDISIFDLLNDYYNELLAKKSL